MARNVVEDNKNQTYAKLPYKEKFVAAENKRKERTYDISRAVQKRDCVKEAMFERVDAIIAYKCFYYVVNRFAHTQDLPQREFIKMPLKTIQINDEKEKRNFSFEEAMKLLPTTEGKRFATVFERGELLVEIYAPQGIDPQQPHTRDELYIVIQGSGFYFNGKESVPFVAGDCLFAPAGVTHRFENFTNDFATWVIFYGPEGGKGD